MSSNLPFQKLEDEYLRLAGQLATGRITREQFEQARGALRLQDAQGRDWSLDDKGDWLMYDGRAWTRAEPSSISEGTNAALPVTAQPAPNAPARRLPIRLILALIALAAAQAMLILAILRITPAAKVRDTASGESAVSTPTSVILLAGAPTLAPATSFAPLPTPTLAVPTLFPTLPLATWTASSPTPCPKPQIASFTINPNEIKRGDNATLNWGVVTNATRDEIDQNIGSVLAPSSRQVKPDRDTTFTLTATGCGGVATAQVSVSVLPFGAGEAGIPQGPQQAQKFLLFDWGDEASFNNAFLYGIEIDTDLSGSYQPFELASNFPDSQYTNKEPFPTDGRYKIRFRWWMIDPKTHRDASFKSQWSVICFNYGKNAPCN